MTNAEKLRDIILGSELSLAERKELLDFFAAPPDAGLEDVAFALNGYISPRELLNIIRSKASAIGGQDAAGWQAALKEEKHILERVENAPLNDPAP